ncbi:MAG TPA: cellulase family glycosylhydrolase [Caproicibacter sp.]|nr:cellulase family glycosylhydrolase [Caproicibacter sp.]
MKQFTGYKKGINLGGWLSQCDHSKQHYDSFIMESDISRIASWGLDHVRLPVDYELIETDHGDFIEDGFQYINNCLRWCEKYGLNMILDLHKTCGYSFDESSADFFQNKKLQDIFVDLWKELSRRYGDFSDHLAFELLNEVVDKDTAQVWNDIAGRTVKAIREYAPAIPILIGGVENNSISSLKLLSMPYDENIVYNFHFYEPLIFTHQSAYWIKEMPSDFSMSYPNQLSEFMSKTAQHLPQCNNQIYSNIRPGQNFFDAVFADAVRVAEERNVALYCGEYGVIDKADVVSTLNWYSEINSAFERYGIGRAAWTYKGKDFGITDEHYAPILDDLIKLL